MKPGPLGIAVVAGASKGIGYACAQRLAREGYSVLALARGESQLVKAKDQIIAQTGAMVECRAVDLRDATPRQYADFVAGMDAIEVAVLNAGWVPDGTLADSDLMAFDEGFRTLLRPVLAGVLGLRNKLRAGRGRVVLMASVTATRPSSDLVVSSTMRTALRAFCEVAASDLARAGVTVNCICPGFVNTPGLAAWLARTAERAHVPTSTLREHCRKNVPLGRFADPAEIGALVAYLASAEAGYITGQTIVVDGGLILGTAIRHERSAVE